MPLVKQDVAQQQLEDKGYQDVKEVDRKLSRLVVRPTFVICDVGGAKGEDLVPLAKQCAFAVNIDLNKWCLQKAKSTFRAHFCTSKLECIQASALQLPFKDETFDLVTSFSVLDHLVTKQNATVAISEFSRTTRRGGFVAVTVPNKLFFLGTIAMNLKKLLEVEVGHTYEQRFTPPELQEILVSSGLSPTIYASTYPTTMASMNMVLSGNLPRFLRKVPQIMVILSLGAKILGIVEKAQVFTLIGARMGYLTKKN